MEDTANALYRKIKTPKPLPQSPLRKDLPSQIVILTLQTMKFICWQTQALSIENRISANISSQLEQHRFKFPAVHGKKGTLFYTSLS